MYVEYAQKHGLLTSSGSDSHGPEKKPIKYRAELSRSLLECDGFQMKYVPYAACYNLTNPTLSSPECTGPSPARGLQALGTLLYSAFEMPSTGMFSRSRKACTPVRTVGKK